MTDMKIVLLNYFMKDDILRSIESVVDDIRGIPFQIAIVVADNSQNKDGIKESLAEKFPDVTYVNSGGNIGFGQGNVKGLEGEASRYYFILNRDTIIPPGERAIERIIRFMDEHPKIGAIGPKLLNMDGSLQYSCYRFDVSSLIVKPLRHFQLEKKYRWGRQRLSRLLMEDFDHQETRPVDWVLGAAMVVRA
ncbi:MAG: glycosyltransferase, partial [Patescibacteria group bacterium]